jgi:transposase
LGLAQTAYHEAAAARDRAFHRLHADGATMQEIADHFGISKGRVNQMIDRHRRTL